MKIATLCSSLAVKLLGSLSYLLIVIFVRFLYLEPHYKDKTQDANQFCILTSWHTNLLLLLLYYAKCCRYLNSNQIAFVSDSFGGKIVKFILKRLNVKVFVNNDNTNVSIIGKIYDLMQNGSSLWFIVDGPKGPFKVINQRYIKLFKCLSSQVIAVSCECTPMVRLTWKWDRLKLPLPFAKVKIVFSKKHNSKLLGESLYDDLG